VYCLLEIQHVEDSLECDEVFDPLDILDSNPFTNKIREKVEKVRLYPPSASQNTL